MVKGPLTLVRNACDAGLIHWLMIDAPRVLPALGRPHAVAGYFDRCDQLTVGLAPAVCNQVGRTEKNSQ